MARVCARWRHFGGGEEAESEISSPPPLAQVFVRGRRGRRGEERSGGRLDFAGLSCWCVRWDFFFPFSFSWIRWEYSFLTFFYQNDWFLLLSRYLSKRIQRILG